MEPMRREIQQKNDLVRWLVEEIHRPDSCFGNPYPYRRSLEARCELAVTWKAEVEAVAGDEKEKRNRLLGHSYSELVAFSKSVDAFEFNPIDGKRRFSGYWSTVNLDFLQQGIEYLRLCVPRQLATPQPWPQEWMVGADNEWQHDNWQHQWPDTAKWPTEWWTFEKLDWHFKELALVGCVVQPISAAGDGPPAFQEWLSQGPSWLLKGTREARYTNRFTREDHAEFCKAWLTAMECANVTNKMQQLQLRWQDLECFCPHTPQVEPATAKQLYWALQKLGGSDGTCNKRDITHIRHISGHAYGGCKCAECFKPIVARAIHFRFEGDCPARRSWLDERKHEAELIDEFASLIRTWMLHDEAVRRLVAGNVALKAEEVQKMRARDAEKAAARQRQYDSRASARVRVEAAAAAAGRSRIIKLNASKWPPPDIKARGSNGECLYVIEKISYPVTCGGKFQLNDGTWTASLSREEFQALPEEERILCQKDRCTHKAVHPQCRGHCKCKGFEKIMSKEIRSSKPPYAVLHKPTFLHMWAGCRFYEQHKITEWIDLSDPILWYWQMTGDTWYVEGNRYTEKRDMLSFNDRSVKCYEAQVQAWRELCGGNTGSKSNTCGGNTGSKSKAVGKRKLHSL